MDDKRIPLRWRMPAALSRDMFDGFKRRPHFDLFHPHNCLPAAARAWCDQLHDIVAQVGTLVCVQHQDQGNTKVLASLLHRRAAPSAPIWTFLQTGVA